jgi:ribosomal protein S17
MMEVLNEDQNSFKSGDKVLIQTSKELVPAIYIEKTNNGHQVKITKTMMGYKSGDVVEVGDKGIVPV